MKRNDKRRDARKPAWMASFENHVLALAPEMAGRLDWNTATFFFNSDVTPEDAAFRVVSRMREETK